MHHSSRANTNSAAAQDRFLFFIMIPFRFRRFVPAAYQAPCCGADYPHGMQKGSGAVPDYKAMYFELFRASVQAVQLLQDAQAHAEQQLLAEDPLPLRLEQPDGEE